MFYRALRAVVNWALRLFYRLHVTGADVSLEGPIIFVGNHPNGLIDPALVFVLTARQVTFLAKAPLFKTPVVSWLVKGIGALPVYRKQDDPTQMTKNEGTLDASVQALVRGGAITLFPEGKSHSEPQLAELKTGCARIALRAAKQGARVRIVPVGLTYEDKTRFRSEVFVEVGKALAVEPGDENDAAAVRELTSRIADALEKVTINLQGWEDLPLVRTAEQLYALREGKPAGEPERIRAFARGMQLLRDEQPERFEALRAEVASFRRRLDLLRAEPSDLDNIYRRSTVLRFVFRNLIGLAGLPFFVAGMALFFVPFWIPWAVAKLSKVPRDVEATIKLLVSLVLAPLWLVALTLAAWARFGLTAGLVALVGTLPLALYTRYFLERRGSALEDVRTFFVLTRRSSLQARLLAEGERIAAQVDALAEELRPRVAASLSGKG